MDEINLDLEAILKMDAAIDKANTYLRKIEYEKSGVLFWTPCAGHSHEKPISYCIVWLSDNRTMGYSEHYVPTAYLMFKGPINIWIDKYSDDESLDSYIEHLKTINPPENL